MLVGAIDWGGTKLRGAVIDDDGQILCRLEEPTPTGSPDAILSRARQLVGEAAQAASVRISDLSSVGVSAPGLVDARSGVLTFAPGSGFREIGIRGSLAPLGVPIFVENDVRASATAELRFGRGRQAGSFLWVTVSTGVGGAIVLDGKVYRGARGLAGEIGHFEVDPGGAVCGCGHRGCLETVASGPALVRRAQSAGLELEKAEELTSMALNGNRIARRLMDEATNSLGRAVAWATNLLDLELVVVGGGVGQSLDLTRIAGVASRHVIEAAQTRPRLARTALGANAGLMGAAAIALEQE